MLCARQCWPPGQLSVDVGLAVSLGQMEPRLCLHGSFPLGPGLRGGPVYALLRKVLRGLDRKQWRLK